MKYYITVYEGLVGITTLNNDEIINEDTSKPLKNSDENNIIFYNKRRAQNWINNNIDPEKIEERDKEYKLKDFRK